jgi:hypothetical protein
MPRVWNFHHAGRRGASDIIHFSREGEDFGKFSPIFRVGGYYRNPVIFQGRKFRNCFLTLELLKMAFYRSFCESAGEFWRR